MTDPSRPRQAAARRARLASVRAWPFAWKLRAGVALLLLVAAVGVAVMLGLADRNRDVTRALAGRELAGVALVLNIDRDAYQAVLALVRAAHDPHAGERAAALEFYAENIGQTAERLTRYRALPGLPAEQRRRAEAAAAARERLAARGDALAARIGRGELAAGVEEETAALAADLDAFRVPLGELEDAHTAAGDALTAAADAGGTAAVRTGILTLLVLAAAGLVAAWLLDRAVTGPVRLVAERARRIAAGDLTGGEVRVATDDEVGRMARDVGRMTRNLSAMIAQVQGAGQAVAGHAGEISALVWETRDAVQHLNAAVGQITAGAEEQAASAQDAFQQTETVSASAARIAEGARETEAALGETLAAARESGRTVADIARGTQEAARVVAAGTGQVRQLRRHSGAIEEFARTITDIARQTNLLALNAAIEAARAGESGRGFSVVADEVRKLAEDAGAAARRTTGVVGELRHDIDQAVAAIEESAAGVEGATGRAHEVGAALDAIFHALEAGRGRARALTGDTARVSEGVRQTAALLGSVASVAEQNAASAQEMAALAEQLDGTMATIAALSGTRDAAEDEGDGSLSALAERLRRLVAAFRVDAGDTSADREREARPEREPVLAAA